MTKNTRRYGTGLVRERLHPQAANHRIRPNIAPAPTAAPPADWTPRTILNQGQRGACVGCGYTADVIANPARTNATPHEAQQFAFHLWRRAKFLYYAGDMAKVNNDAAGTGMQAGALAAREMGLFGRFLWADSIDDVRAAIQVGPVVIAVNTGAWVGYDPQRWTGNFRRPNRNETTTTSHCMAVTAYHPAHHFPRLNLPGTIGTGPTEPAYFIRNSWSDDYGKVWKRGRELRPNRKPGQSKYRLKLRFQRPGGGWIRETDLAWALEDYGWAFGAAVLPVDRVDPDTLGGLAMIAANHPIDAPYEGGYGPDAWDQG